MNNKKTVCDLQIMVTLNRKMYEKGQINEEKYLTANNVLVKKITELEGAG